MAKGTAPASCSMRSPQWKHVSLCQATLTFAFILMISAGVTDAMRALRSTTAGAATTPEGLNTTVAASLAATATVCPSKSGYSVLVNYDHAGNDISPTWVADPQSACDTDSTCKGFNLRQDGTGQAKTETLKDAFQSAGFCLYTKQDVACPPRTGYTVLVDRTHNGDDTASSEPTDDAAAACDLDPTCTGFSWGSLTGQGTLKTNTSGTTYSPGQCLYVKKPTSCPYITGYSRLVDRDHQSNDISDSFIPLPQDSCTPNSYCVGFNLRPDGTGMLKTVTVDGSFYSHGMCLYTKASAICPYKAGYSRLVNYDHKGDDIANTTTADPEPACTSDPSCQGFNIRADGLGQPKNATLVNSFSAPGVCLYTKAAIACPAMLGYSVIVDVDHAGDDASKYGSMHADAACNRNPNCTGFSRYSWNGYGMPKYNVSTSYTSPGQCLYAKTVTICPSVPGYDVLPDHDHQGDDITGAWVADTAAECNVDSECVGFNRRPSDGSGMTKTATVQGAFYSHGFCLYTKAAGSR